MSGPGGRVAVAEDGDVASWLQLRTEVEPLFGPMPDFEATLRRHMERGWALCVRDDDGRVAGGVLVRRPPKDPSIGWLAVRADRRGSGVGAALVEAALGDMPRPCEVTVDTFGDDNPAGRPARRLYERFGFVPAEVLEHGPEGGTRQRFRAALTEAPAVEDRAGVARELLAAYDDVRLAVPPSVRWPRFDTTAAYDVLDRIDDERLRRGWRPVGWKIGFTNRGLWERYGVDRAMWARVWDRTIVRCGPSGTAEVEVDRYVAPRLEPEVVVGLRAPLRPGIADPAEVLRSVEWVAPGFEVVQCVFPDWRFTAADCAAAFGLHGGLVVGEPVPVDGWSATDLVTALEEASVELSRDGEVVDRGVGANALGSPLLALAHLADALASRGAALAAGDVVTTGTLTDAWPLTSGTTWRSTFTGAPFAGLTLTVR